MSRGEKFSSNPDLLWPATSVGSVGVVSNNLDDILEWIEDLPEYGTKQIEQPLFSPAQIREAVVRVGSDVSIFASEARRKNYEFSGSVDIAEKIAKELPSVLNVVGKNPGALLNLFMKMEPGFLKGAATLGDQISRFSYETGVPSAFQVFRSFGGLASAADGMLSILDHLVSGVQEMVNRDPDGEFAKKLFSYDSNAVSLFNPEIGDVFRSSGLDNFQIDFHVDNKIVGRVTVGLLLERLSQISNVLTPSDFQFIANDLQKVQSKILEFETQEVRFFDDVLQKRYVSSKLPELDRGARQLLGPRDDGISISASSAIGLGDVLSKLKVVDSLLPDLPEKNLYYALDRAGVAMQNGDFEEAEILMGNFIEYANGFLINNTKQAAAEQQERDRLNKAKELAKELAKAQEDIVRTMPTQGQKTFNLQDLTRRIDQSQRPFDEVREVIQGIPNLVDTTEKELGAEIPQEAKRRIKELSDEIDGITTTLQNNSSDPNLLTRQTKEQENQLLEQAGAKSNELLDTLNSAKKEIEAEQDRQAKQAAAEQQERDRLNKAKELAKELAKAQEDIVRTMPTQGQKTFNLQDLTRRIDQSQRPFDEVREVIQGIPNLVDTTEKELGAEIPQEAKRRIKELSDEIDGITTTLQNNSSDPNLLTRQTKEQENQLLEQAGAKSNELLDTLNSAKKEIEAEQDRQAKQAAAEQQERDRLNKAKELAKELAKAQEDIVRTMPTQGQKTFNLQDLTRRIDQSQRPFDEVREVIQGIPNLVDTTEKELGAEIPQEAKRRIKELSDEIDGITTTLQNNSSDPNLLTRQTKEQENQLLEQAGAKSNELLDTLNSAKKEIEAEQDRQAKQAAAEQQERDRLNKAKELAKELAKAQEDIVRTMPTQGQKTFNLQDLTRRIDQSQRPFDEVREVIQGIPNLVDTTEKELGAEIPQEAKRRIKELSDEIDGITTTLQNNSSDPNLLTRQTKEQENQLLEQAGAKSNELLDTLNSAKKEIEAEQDRQAKQAAAEQQERDRLNKAKELAKELAKAQEDIVRTMPTQGQKTFNLQDLTRRIDQSQRPFDEVREVIQGIPNLVDTTEKELGAEIPQEAKRRIKELSDEIDGITTTLQNNSSDPNLLTRQTKEQENQLLEQAGAKSNELLDTLNSAKKEIEAEQDRQAKQAAAEQQERDRLNKAKELAKELAKAQEDIVRTMPTQGQKTFNLQDLTRRIDQSQRPFDEVREVIQGIPNLVDTTEKELGAEIPQEAKRRIKELSDEIDGITTTLQNNSSDPNLLTRQTKEQENQLLEQAGAKSNELLDTLNSAKKEIEAEQDRQAKQAAAEQQERDRLNKAKELAKELAKAQEDIVRTMPTQGQKTFNLQDLTRRIDQSQRPFDEVREVIQGIPNLVDTTEKELGAEIPQEAKRRIKELSDEIDGITTTLQNNSSDPNLLTRQTKEQENQLLEQAGAKSNELLDTLNSAKKEIEAEQDRQAKQAAAEQQERDRLNKAKELAKELAKAQEDIVRTMPTQGQKTFNLQDLTRRIDQSQRPFDEVREVIQGIPNLVDTTEKELGAEIPQEAKRRIKELSDEIDGITTTLQNNSSDPNLLTRQTKEQENQLLEQAGAKSNELLDTLNSAKKEIEAEQDRQAKQAAAEQQERDRLNKAKELAKELAKAQEDIVRTMPTQGQKTFNLQDLTRRIDQSQRPFDEVREVIQGIPNLVDTTEKELGAEIPQEAKRRIKELSDEIDGITTTLQNNSSDPNLLTRQTKEQENQLLEQAGAKSNELLDTLNSAKKEIEAEQDRQAKQAAAEQQERDRLNKAKELAKELAKAQEDIVRTMPTQGQKTFNLQDLTRRIDQSQRPFDEVREVIQGIPNLVDTTEKELGAEIPQEAKRRIKELSDEIDGITTTLQNNSSDPNLLTRQTKEQENQLLEQAGAKSNELLDTLNSAKKEIEAEQDRQAKQAAAEQRNNLTRLASMMKNLSEKSKPVFIDVLKNMDLSAMPDDVSNPEKYANDLHTFFHEKILNPIRQLNKAMFVDKDSQESGVSGDKEDQAVMVREGEDQYEKSFQEGYLSSLDGSAIKGFGKSLSRLEKVLSKDGEHLPELDSDLKQVSRANDKFDKKHLQSVCGLILKTKKALMDENSFEKAIGSDNLDNSSLESEFLYDGVVPANLPKNLRSFVAEVYPSTDTTSVPPANIPGDIASFTAIFARDAMSKMLEVKRRLPEKLADISRAETSSVAGLIGAQMADEAMSHNETLLQDLKNRVDETYSSLEALVEDPLNIQKLRGVEVEVDKILKSLEGVVINTKFDDLFKDCIRLTSSSEFASKGSGSSENTEMKKLLFAINDARESLKNDGLDPGQRQEMQDSYNYNLAKLGRYRDKRVAGLSQEQKDILSGKKKVVYGGVDAEFAEIKKQMDDSNHAVFNVMYDFCKGVFANKALSKFKKNIGSAENFAEDLKVDDLTDALKKIRSAYETINGGRRSFNPKAGFNELKKYFPVGSKFSQVTEEMYDQILLSVLAIEDMGIKNKLHTAFNTRVRSSMQSLNDNLKKTSAGALRGAKNEEPSESTHGVTNYNMTLRRFVDDAEKCVTDFFSYADRHMPEMYANLSELIGIKYTKQGECQYDDDLKARRGPLAKAVVDVASGVGVQRVDGGGKQTKIKNKILSYFATGVAASLAGVVGDEYGFKYVYDDVSNHFIKKHLNLDEMQKLKLSTDEASRMNSEAAAVRTKITANNQRALGLVALEKNDYKKLLLPQHVNDVARHRNNILSSFANLKIEDIKDLFLGDSAKLGSLAGTTEGVLMGQDARSSFNTLTRSLSGSGNEDLRNYGTNLKKNWRSLKDGVGRGRINARTFPKIVIGATSSGKSADSTIGTIVKDIVPSVGVNDVNEAKKMLKTVTAGRSIRSPSSDTSSVVKHSDTPGSSHVVTEGQRRGGSIVPVTHGSGNLTRAIAPRPSRSSYNGRPRSFADAMSGGLNLGSEKGKMAVSPASHHKL